MTAPHAEEPVMTMPEIAELAGVRRPVVSTWRRRYPDFPAAAGEEAGSPLFRATDVLNWLVATGRANRADLEGDLRVYTLARLGSRMPRKDLVPTLTALICLRHLADEELYPDQVDAPLVRLRGLAASVDPGDTMLADEVKGLRDPTLASAVDELVEAAWGAEPALERILGVRDRLGAKDLSADRLAPALEGLVARLSDAAGLADRHGVLRLADPNAGIGDLIVAVARSLRDDQPLSVTAWCADEPHARLVRRRLAVRDLHEGGFDVRAGAPGPVIDAALVVTQLAYKPAEERNAERSFRELHSLLAALPPATVAIIIAPADTMAALDPGEEAGILRGELLATDAVKAAIRLPGGLMPYRPGYECALWVLTTEKQAGEPGRVLLADISDRQLSPALSDALATDVLAWRNRAYSGAAHAHVYTAPSLVRDLVSSSRPLLPDRSRPGGPLQKDVHERVARALELEQAVWEARPDDARLAGDLAAALTPEAPRTATIAELTRGGRSRSNDLSLRRGTRLEPELIDTDIDATSTHAIFGPAELTGESRYGRRRVDRISFAAAHPEAHLSSPGDVILSLAPRPAAAVDHAGLSVVEYPARVLRITERGKRNFTPRVLAALLNLAERADGAIRPAQRITELRLPLLPTAVLERFDRLLTEIEERHDRARRELDALHELREIAASGLADGTLTFHR